MHVPNNTAGRRFTRNWPNSIQSLRHDLPRMIHSAFNALWKYASSAVAQPLTCMPNNSNKRYHPIAFYHSHSYRVSAPGCTNALHCASSSCCNKALLKKWKPYALNTNSTPIYLQCVASVIARPGTCWKAHYPLKNWKNAASTPPASWPNARSPGSPIPSTAKRLTASKTTTPT